MKDSVLSQALARLLPALAVVCLLGSCDLLRSKEKIAHALAGVEKARNELVQVEAPVSAAAAKQAEAASALRYADEQIKTQEDQEGLTWWRSQRLDKQRDLGEAKRAWQRADFERRRLGRDYVDAELVYKKAGGSFRDPELAQAWIAKLASEAQPSAAETRLWSSRLILYGAGFLGLCLIMLLAVTRSSWLRVGRKLGLGTGLPRIRLRSAEEKPKEMAPLGGRYKLDLVVGHGGMGRVWIGKDIHSGVQVAVKQMAAIEGVDRYAVRELYKREARALEALRHPHIVRLIESVDADDGLYLVFEFVTGKTLQHVLAERKVLAWPMARGIFVPVAQALGFAHSKGLVHRDIKPQNIMITDAGVVKVMDFGLAKSLGVPQAAPAVPSGPLPAPSPMDMMTAKTKTMAGTPSYICPEAAQGIVSPGYDIFALGVCLYQCLTGGLPFGYGGWTADAAMRYIPPGVLVTGLDRRLDGLLAGMLEADLAKRIPSCEELLRRMNDIPVSP